MPELTTREQALAYLAEYSPTRTFELHPFPYGWVVVTKLTPEQMASGRGLGLAKDVLDKETGKLWGYPSWSIDMVIDAFTEMKQTGVNRTARQIYPHRHRIDLVQTAQGDTTVEYRMTVTSLTDPPEPTQTHQLTLEKDTYLHEPTDSTSAIASSHLHHMKDHEGTWPDTLTTQV